tara:strand:- start:29596 stop:32163 length:2568 start_codon:yes stop_codon:yes gene_type:complete
LKNNITPNHYDLFLKPDITNAVFSGEVKIHLTSLQDFQNIELDAAEIDVITASIQQNNRVFPLEFTLDEKNESITFHCEEKIHKGESNLNIKFSGILNDRLRGFYISKYTDENGVENKLASTQFEPTDARRAFPCFDEPSQKATFSVSVTINTNHRAISNMPEEKEQNNNDGTKTVWFTKTPIMSTYVLALVVGQINCIEKTSDNGTLVRVWSTEGLENNGQYALDVAIKILQYLEDYFGIKYPLPKLDHVAIPDFAAGAMENWGCITYREPALLFDSSNSSSSTRQLVAEIIAHEMAHMWFGDLVTMHWWNDLWLNESFASWMGDKTIDSIYPEWQKWTQFLAADTGHALRLDGLLNSHPIEQEVQNPNEIGQLFDAISYSKGASIIRMLENFLGEDTFRKGINSYLNKFQYKNASTKDLWESLQIESGEPVKEIMEAWIKTPGYPYIDIEIDRIKDANQISLSQKRFSYNKNIKDTSDKVKWPIPIDTIDGNGKTSSFLLSADSQKFTVPRINENTWFKINVGQTGFYRVRYPEKYLSVLNKGVKQKHLGPADRLGLISDSFAMVQAMLAPASNFLNQCSAYTSETSQPVWSELLYGLGYIQNLVYEQPYYENFTQYCRSLLTEIRNEIGWDAKINDNHLNSLLRSQILLSSGQFEETEVLQKAKYELDNSLSTGHQIHADLRRPIYILAAKQGDQDLYDILWKLHSTTNLQEEKVRLLSALTQFKNSSLITKTLNRALSNKVRTHETISVIVHSCRNQDGRQLTWEFMKENWKELNRRYGEGGFGLMYMIQALSGFTTQDALNDVDRFFKINPVPAADLTLSQTKETIENNIDWIKYNDSDLSEWSNGIRMT